MRIIERTRSQRTDLETGSAAFDELKVKTTVGVRVWVMEEMNGARKAEIVWGLI